MEIPQAAKAPPTDPTACPVCGAPLSHVGRRREHPSVAVYRFECGSSDIIRAGMHWPQEAKDAAPPCLYIKGLRERLEALQEFREATLDAMSRVGGIPETDRLSDAIEATS